MSRLVAGQQGNVQVPTQDSRAEPVDFASVDVDRLRTSPPAASPRLQTPPPLPRTQRLWLALTSPSKHSQQQLADPTHSTLLIDYCQCAAKASAAVEEADGKLEVVDAYTRCYDPDRFREEFMPFLDAWAAHPISRGQTIETALRCGEDYSVWWTYGPGATRQASRGPLIPTLRKIWIASVAIQQTQPKSVVIDCDSRFVRESLLRYCRRKGIAVSIAATTSKDGSRKDGDQQGPQTTSTGGQRLRWTLSLIGALMALPVLWLWLWGRALGFRCLLRSTVTSRSALNSVDVVLTTLYPRHFRTDSDGVQNSYWQRTLESMQAAGVQPALLLYTKSSALRLRTLRRLAANAKLMPLPQQFACGRTFWRAVPRQGLATARLGLAIWTGRLENAPKLAGCEVAELIVSRLVSSVGGLAKWNRNSAALAASLQAAPNVASVLVTEEFYTKGLQTLAATKQLGVRSIGIQHGLITPTHLIYTPTQAAMEGMPCPDEMAVYGPYAARVLCENGCYPAQRLRIVGASQFDGLADMISKQEARRRLGLPADGLIVLIATQPSWNHNQGAHPAEMIFRSLLPHRPVLSCVKMHPNDKNKAVYSQAAAAAGLEPMQFFADQPQRLLAACDLLITGASTMIMEATLLRRPVICIPAESQPAVFPYTDSGMAFEVTSAEALPAALEAALRLDPQQQQTTEFLDEHLGPTRRGQSAATVAELVRHSNTLSACYCPNGETHD